MPFVVVQLSCFHEKYMPLLFFFLVIFNFLRSLIIHQTYLRSV